MEVKDHNGKTVQRIEVGSDWIVIHFTDGTEAEIRAHTTEEGWISIDGESN